MNKKIYLQESVVNSHEIVSYFMVLMNYLTAKKMKEFKKGIYRFAKTNVDYVITKKYSRDIAKF